MEEGAAARGGLMVKTKCDLCKGTGGRGGKQPYCPVCGGTGYVTRRA